MECAALTTASCRRTTTDRWTRSAGSCPAVTRLARGRAFARGRRPAFPREGKLASPTPGMGLEGFVHGLEGARDYALASRVLLRPSVEVGLRHDGEGAETGAVLDVGGGLVVSDSSTGLAVNLRVRMLVMHQAEGFRERAMAVSLSYNPTPSTLLGFTARVAPSWGRPGRERRRGRCGAGPCAWAAASIPTGREACQSNGHRSRGLSSRHPHCTRSPHRSRCGAPTFRAGPDTSSKLNASAIAKFRFACA